MNYKTLVIFNKMIRLLLAAASMYGLVSACILVYTYNLNIEVRSL